MTVDLGGHSSEEEPFVDIEQMLWADSDECLLGGDGSSMQQQLMLAQLNANTRHQQLPPKYFTGVQCSPQKRRVHRRTFGERCRPFGFEGAATTGSMDPAATTSSAKKLSAPSNASRSSPADNQHQEVSIKCEDQAMDDVQEFGMFYTAYVWLWKLLTRSGAFAVYIKQEVMCSPQRSTVENTTQLYQTPVRSAAPSSPFMTSEPSDLVMKTPLPMVHESSQQFSPADAMGKTMQSKEVVPKAEPLDWTNAPESHVKQLPSSLMFGQPAGVAASLPPRYFSGTLLGLLFIDENKLS